MVSKETLSTQCVNRRRKTRYTLFFIVRFTKDLLIFDLLTAQSGINHNYKCTPCLKERERSKLIELAKYIREARKVRTRKVEKELTL